MTAAQGATPLTIAVPDPVLADLRDRLLRTRFTDPTPGPSWAAGTDPAYLRALVDYWASRFDLRMVERRLNAYPNYLVDLEGSAVHFVHVPGVRAPGGPEPLPIVLTHGWPSAFTEMLAVIGPLTDPGAHGADPVDAFDVVVPSLPGFTGRSPASRPPSRPSPAAGSR